MKNLRFFFLWLNDEFHHIFFQLIGKFCGFSLWPIGKNCNFFWNRLKNFTFLLQPTKEFWNFFNRTNCLILRNFPSTNGWISQFFFRLINKFHIFSCDWLPNFAFFKWLINCHIFRWTIDEFLDSPPPLPQFTGETSVTYSRNHWTKFVIFPMIEWKMSICHLFLIFIIWLS